MGVKFTEQDLEGMKLRQPGLRVAAAERPATRPVAAPAQSWSFIYLGKAVSLNDFYSGMHWTARKKLRDKWHHVFLDLLAEAQVQPVTAFRLDIRYNSRLDCENVVGTAKLLVDAMKGVYVEDDSKKYYKGISIVPDETLKHNTYLFTIISLP